MIGRFCGRQLRQAGEGTHIPVFTEMTDAYISLGHFKNLSSPVCMLPTPFLFVPLINGPWALKS